MTQPPISGPAATATAAIAAEQRVGERALAALVARRGERRDRRDDEHGAEPLDARPADQQHGRFGLSAVVSDPTP